MSRVSRRLPDSFEPNELTNETESLRRSGETLVDLTVSNPTEVGLLYPKTEIRHALGEAATFPYRPEPRGGLAAREAIVGLSEDLGGTPDPDRLWITASSSESYSFLFKLLCDPGDDVLIPTPSYPLFEHLLSLEGVASSPYALRYEGTWRTDFDALERAVTPRTRALVVVNPNNPTGNYLKEDEVGRLFAFAREKNLAVIADEVFFPFPLGTCEAPRSLLSYESPVPVFTLGGLSKQFGLPQMKIAWLHLSGPADALPSLAERIDWIADNYLSVSTPIQNALPGLLNWARPMTAGIRQRIEENHRLLLEFGSKGKLDPLPSEGGWNAVLRLPDPTDEEAFALELLRRKKILVFPGFYFDLPISSLVVSLLTPQALFRKGLEAIASA